MAALATEARPRFACPNWWDLIQAGRTPMPDVPVNGEKAAQALAFFNRLRLPDVAGNPKLADACGDWFRDILVAFITSENPATRERLVWECLCMVPKKSSKTTYTAALALTALYMDETPNAQMLLIGPTQNISNRLFGQAQGMIRLDDDLRKIFKVQDHLKKITRIRTGTKLEVKTFDASIVTGEIPVLTIIDELHELGKNAAAQSVMQQIRGGGITQTGGRLLMITTQSDKEPAGIWRSELMKARAIRDGDAGPSPIMLPVLYEFPQELQKDETYWRDRSNWHLVLPNLGRSISMARLQADYDNNGKTSPEAEQIWISQHLNIEIGIGLHSERWIGADHWPSCTDKALVAPGIEGLDLLLERSEVAVVGGDIGGLDDLLGLAVIGRDAETRDWLVWCRAWASQMALERRKEIASKLQDLEAAGDLVIDDDLDRHVTDVADICDRVKDARLLPSTAGIGLDPYGVAALFDELTSRGYAEDEVAGVGQGFKLNGAIKGIERRLLQRSLHHGGQPLMTWVLGNAKAEARGNNTMITKAKAGSGKIDPLVALFNAAILMDANPVAASPARSYIEERDVVVL